MMNLVTNKVNNKNNMGQIISDGVGTCFVA